MHQKMHMINQKWNKVQKTNVHSIGKHILIIQIEDDFFAKYCVTNYSCINAVELPLWIKYFFYIPLGFINFVWFVLVHLFIPKRNEASIRDSHKQK